MRVWAAEKATLGLKPKLAAEAMAQRLTEAQRAAHQRILRLPLVAGPPRFLDDHRAAIAALLLQGDEEVTELGGGPAITAPPSDDRRMRAMLGVLTRIEQMNATPDSTVWRIRLLVDTMLNNRGAGSKPRSRKRLDS